MEAILLRLLWIGSVAGQAAVLFRISKLAELRAAYAFFGSFLAANLSRSLVLVCVDFRSPAYTLIWTVSEPLLLILQLLAAGEVYDHVCASYPALAKYKYRLLAIMGLMAGAIAAFTLVLGIPRMMTWRYFTAVSMKSFVETASVVFLLLLCAVFRHFPVARARNLQTHWRILTIYFGLNAVGLIAMVLLPGRVWINMVVLAGVIVCYAIWMSTFSANGEVVRSPASDDERRQWLTMQDRASAALTGVTLRSVVGLLLHPH